MSGEHRPALDLASDAAQQALTRFSLDAIRVWLNLDGKVILAGTALKDGGHHLEEMSAEAVSHAMSSGGELRGTFMGTPLQSASSVLGYVECHATHAISFSEAASIESWARELTDAVASALATEELESPNRGSVLIAEDDAGIRKLLQALLIRNGFTVTAVENGQLACDSAPELLPDLILLDWMMPILDGRSAVARLKSDPRTRHIPVVMLTSQARTEDKVSALEAGAQDYLTKPFDSRELVARIEQQLRWRNLLAAPETLPHPAPAQPLSQEVPSDDGGPVPPPPGGDYWSAAVQAQQVGKYRHALEYYLQEAENCDNAKHHARAAIAFRSASVVAGQLQNLDLSNKLLRLAGKMYLSWAESASDAKAVQEAYVNAARCFLSAGNLKLAKKSVDIAESMHSVMSDDRPSPLR